MRAAAVFVLLILALVVALIVAAGWSSDRAANLEMARANGEAIVIRAQGQAALDRAQAAQLTAAAASIAMLAAVPWGVLSCLGVLGLAVIALAAALVVRRPTIVQTPPQLITREIVYLPAPGQSRREVWQALSDNRAAGLLESGQVVDAAPRGKRRE
jgi:hypothetical protein